MLTVAIVGSKGRMGQMLLACAGRLPELRVGAAVDQGDDLSVAVGAGEVVVDFSAHSVTAGLAEICAAHGRPMVIGTTGHDEEEKARVRACAQRIPLVWSSNFSTGVNTLFWLTRKAAEILGPGFDAEIVEMHHRYKKDAPSGTASTLAEIVAGARGVSVGESLRHGRQGMPGERPAAEIGVHSLRGGDVVGDHTVIFATPGERVELTHKASSRETFALGALRAAQWVWGRPPGLYTMQDVLSLK